MSQHASKYISKSEKYKNVYLSTKGSGILYYTAMISIKGNKLQKDYKTEIEAAKSVDMFLIKNGKQPVSILIKKP